MLADLSQIWRVCAIYNEASLLLSITKYNFESYDSFCRPTGGKRIFIIETTAYIGLIACHALLLTYVKHSDSIAYR